MIQSKVLLGFIIFIVIPIIAIGIVGSALFQSVLQEKYSEQSQLVNASVARNIATVFKDATASSDQSMFSSRVQEFLNQAPGERDMTEVPAILNQTFLMYGPLDSVTLYTLDGETYSRSKSDNSPVPMQKLRETGILDEITKRNGISLWFGPYERPELSSSERYFTQIRVVNDLNRQERIGYVCLQYQFNELENVFRFYSSKLNMPNHFLLVNPDGLIVYDNQSQISGGNLYDRIGQKLDLNQDVMSRKLSFDGTASILSVQPLEMRDLGIGHLSLVSIMPLSYLTGEIVSIIRTVGIIMAAILISALIYNLVYLKRYILFIIKLMNAMKQVELGDLSIRMSLDTQDETGALARSFNRLAGKVEELIGEVKQEQTRKNKAELMLLQAQIKPHFIMNTLESINALNLRGETEKVSQMVYRLGENLHISFQEQEEITLVKEIGYLKNYFEIQKVRFGHRFDYEISMPPELGRFLVLKFTLQPLVENSIQHGLEHITHKAKIRVRVREYQGNLQLWVEDNGCGISNDILGSFYYRKSIHIGTMSEVDNKTGLGVMNVADRLRMHYGNGFGMFICSEPGSGTVIQCLIPKREGGYR
ncbi:cache domain-containing sensor histidine kinase [Paenibacillus favisporus]|uniref:cache domain-containing sensor histidine kinase n=1 Tax=Paenibacillus favisporus TaxID=221028 RepID=UPI0013D05DD6|nr:sensor histidine kinase [Paenibacillus favisporus]